MTTEILNKGITIIEELNELENNITLLTKFKNTFIEKGIKSNFILHGGNDFHIDSIHLSENTVLQALELEIKNNKKVYERLTEQFHNL